MKAHKKRGTQYLQDHLGYANGATFYLEHHAYTILLVIIIGNNIETCTITPN